jgi:frataxin-like iron-binding protein CyaY
VSAPALPITVVPAGDDLNDIIDDHPDGSSFDAGLSDGVLTLKLGKHGT